MSEPPGVLSGAMEDRIEAFFEHFPSGPWRIELKHFSCAEPTGGAGAKAPPGGSGGQEPPRVGYGMFSINEGYLAVCVCLCVWRGVCIVNTEEYGLFFYSPLCDQLSQVQTSRLNSTAGTSPQSNLICFI